MECYEQNKKVMQERFASVLEEIEKADTEDTGLKVESVITRDGNHALMVTKDDKHYRMNSAYRPLEEARKWADQYRFQNLDINIFMFGFGNGIFVRELLHRAADDARIILWEPNIEIFHYVLETENVSDILGDSRFQLFLGEKGLSSYKVVVDCMLSWHNASTQIRCDHIGYRELFEEDYKKFLEVISRANALMRMRSDTNAYFAHTSIHNVLQNMKYIRHSNYITELIGKIPEDIPAIIVSAGPSLEKNMSLLKQAEGKAVIVATDSAVRILEQNELPYDFIVTVDPRKPPWYLSKFLGCQEKPLICTLQSQKDLMKFHTGRKIWGCGSIFLEDVYRNFGMKFPMFNVGGSVATNATEVARILGLKTLILIGQDLAYEGDRTHAGGYENHVLNEKLTIEMTEGIDGDLVKTRYDWQVYKDWFETFITEHEDIRLIDATEGGALIHGSEVIPFSDAIQKYCEGKRFVFSELMKKTPETFQVVDFAPIESEILHLEKGFANITKKAKEGKKLAEEFLAAGRKISPKKHEHILKELKKINGFIEKQSGYEIIDMYTFNLAVRELRDMNQITGDNFIDETNSIKSALKIYNGFIQAVEELKDALEQSISDI